MLIETLKSKKFGIGGKYCINVTFWCMSSKWFVSTLRDPLAESTLLSLDASCHSHVKGFSEFMKTSIFNIQKVHISWTPSSRMYRKIPEQIWYRVFGGYGELSTCNNSTLFCIHHLVSLFHYYKSMKNRRSAKFRIGSVVIECPKLLCKMTRVFTRQKGYTIRHNISYRIYK